jgi:electron transfer flavoprotein alpha subunit
LSANSVDAVLLPGSYDGRDVAGHLSARLDLPVLTNVTGIGDEGGIVTEHPLFGGSKIAKARVLGEGPALVVVRPKSFSADVTRESAASLTTGPAVDASHVARIVATHVEEREGPALEEAAVVVSGGRGVGSPQGYAAIEELANLLGGAAGASRAIVDAGWVPYARQVGQTGKTVKPTVYIACGISGATQHMVGMKGSQHIVAINKDADAPIFSIADLGIVGDAQTVVPALIALLKARG